MPISASPTDLLAVEELYAGYGAIQVLKGVSIRLQSGEIVAIVGANGAGKSTLLRTIMGSLRLRGGSIRFEGTVLAGLSPHRIAERGIRMVPEGRRIFPNLSVEENILVGGFLRSRQEVKAALERAFGVFPILAERRYQLASTLSGGQQQMLALARALAGEPRLLMLDEPSLGLAPMVVEEIFQRLADLRSAKIGLLLVEQNARKALDLADRGYVFENGRVVMEGLARDLSANDSVIEAYLGGHV
jgi:branched-chain amino acid transport system ATP-binding protein